jgi:RimJ/RimL family protein N-acetyltransferase
VGRSKRHAIYQRARFDGATDLEQTALYIGHWALMGFGYWVIEEKATGEFVGDVGFADFKRDITASMRGKPELGFALASRFHGKGYATEAVRAALAWADAELPEPRTVCMVTPQNVASLHVVGKCGYQVFENGVYNDQPVLFLTRDGRRA